MRRLAIRLGSLAFTALLISQFALPPYLENGAEERLTEHGGQADVDMDAIPAIRLLVGDGQSLHIRASKLSFDLERDQRDVFERLDDFSDVTVAVSDSRAGPFAIQSFGVFRKADRLYTVLVAGEGAAGDVARYAGSRLGGGFGEALAGLAAGALGQLSRPIPFNARMEVDTRTGEPIARSVQGNVAGLPAGPLAQIVANALLSAF